MKRMISINSTALVVLGMFLLVGILLTGNVSGAKPTVENAFSSAPSVYRGQTIDISIDGDDAEDGDDWYHADAEFKYRLNGTSSWLDAPEYLDDEYQSGIDQNWHADFHPPAAPTKAALGLYDFRFRLKDTDDEWSDPYYKYSWIEVMNNMPVIDDLIAGKSEIFRGDINGIWITSNVTEAEDSEDSLNVLFEWDAVDDGLGNWQTLYLSQPPQYDLAGYWKTKFTPPLDAPLGDYHFRVNITDLDGDFDVMIENSLIEVKNNLPGISNLRASATGVRAGAGFIYILADGDDTEDIESELILVVEYKHESAGPTEWVSDYMVPPSEYDGTSLRIKFQPPESALDGLYDFRAKVIDKDGGESDWIYNYNMVEVYPPDPEIVDVTAQKTEIYRKETLIITVNATDVLVGEDELTPHFQRRYRPSGGSWGGWSDVTLTYSYDYGAEYWKAEWTPASDDPIGYYQFQACVSNPSLGYSDWDQTNEVEVMNNLPLALDIKASAYEVKRGEQIFIDVKGSDVEDDELGYDLEVDLEWSRDGLGWFNNYLGNPGAIAGGWIRIPFDPPTDLPDSELGEYDFRIMFRDNDDGESDYLLLSTGHNKVEVQNVDPTADSITVPSSGYRLEQIEISADGSDLDGSEEDLVPTFQWRSESGGWIDIIGSPYYDGSDGSWKLDFIPPADAELGTYDFRVKFSDGLSESSWEEKSDYFELLNNDPVVEIISPSDGEQKNQTITFEATATDAEDGTDLLYEWDFDDGNTSDEESPTHTFDPGVYVVTLTVTDKDGGTGTDSVTIEIPELPPPASPATPANVTAEALSSDKIKVEWSPNTEPDILGYIILRSTSPDGPWVDIIAAVGKEKTSYTDSGLEPESTYYYRIIAIDNASDISPPSLPVGATTHSIDEPPAVDPTPPATPANVTAEALSSDKIEVGWSPNTEFDIFGYIIQRSASLDGPWTQTASVDDQITSYTDTGLEPETTYYYRLIAVDNDFDQSPPSLPVGATTDGIEELPATPADVTAEVISSDKVKVEWSPNTEPDLLGYIVQRSTSPEGPWVDAAAVGKEKTSYTDAGLEPEGTYYYRIIVVNNASCESLPSQPVGATTAKLELTVESEEDFPWLWVLMFIMLVIIAVLLVLLYWRMRPEEKKPLPETTEEVGYPEYTPPEEKPLVPSTEVLPQEVHEETTSEPSVSPAPPPPPPPSPPSEPFEAKKPEASEDVEKKRLPPPPPQPT